jgi:organic radical activating enzyme
MEKIKISECFYSIQGEGRFMGVPSVFLRTFGCNFQCAGFGLPRGEKTTEVDPIAANVQLYKSYEDLPLVSTGCDSYASWHPAFKHLSPFYTIDEIVDKVVDTLPYKEWRDEHLIITGGEPLLKWQYLYPELLSHPKMQNLKELTFETNGTQALTDDFKSWIHREWHHDGSINMGRGRDTFTFSVSAKLPCSGEAFEKAIRPEIVAEYEEYGYVYLKFVIANEQDAEDAECAIGAYRAAGVTGPVYFMPVGGVESVYQLNNRAVADLAMKRGYRYSDRLQVPLFKNEWGT